MRRDNYANDIMPSEIMPKKGARLNDRVHWLVQREAVVVQSWQQDVAGFAPILAVGVLDDPVRSAVADAIAHRCDAMIYVAVVTGGKSSIS